MAVKKSACKNHPEESTSRRCFYCHDYICSVCQHNYRHHIYCGFYCAVRDYIRETYTGLSREFRLLVIFIILSNIFTYVLVTQNKKTEPYTDRIQSVTKPPSIIPIVDTAFSIPSNYVSISGQVGQSGIVVLEKNGQFSDTKIVMNGAYEFRNLKIKYGTNHFRIFAMIHPDSLVMIDSFAIQYISDRIEKLAVSIEKIKINQKACALTFDAGSAATGADSILEILNAKGIQSTIFLTGAFIKMYPDYVKQIAEQGHECANHTYSHPHLTTYASNMQHISLDQVNRAFIQSQLHKTDSVFLSLTGRELFKFWRAPFGEFNQDILLWAAELGYLHIGWSRYGDTRDWVADEDDPLYLSSAQIKQRILSLADSDKLKGSIILMHLNSSRATDPVYRMLADLIDELHARDYELLTVSKLLNLTFSI